MSQTANKHLELLKSILQRFREYKLKLNAEKSEFIISEIPFLGYKIIANGLSLDLSKLNEYKRPASRKKTETIFRVCKGDK